MADTIPTTDALKSTSLMTVGIGLIALGAEQITAGNNLGGSILSVIGVVVLIVKYKCGY